MPATPQRKRRRRTQAEIARARKKAEASRRYYLRKRHQMSEEQYDLIYTLQGGHCYFCTAQGKGRKLAVDHDHKKAREECSHEHDTSCQNCWRGLLCQKCNNYIGYLRDNANAGLMIYDYLTAPPAQRMGWKLTELSTELS